MWCERSCCAGPGPGGITFAGASAGLATLLLGGARKQHHAWLRLTCCVSRYSCYFYSYFYLLSVNVLAESG